MFFAVIQNNQPVKYPLDYENVYRQFLEPAGIPQTPIDFSYLESIGIVRVTPQDVPIVGSTSIVSAPVPTFINGEWVEVYPIRQMTDEEINQSSPALSESIRRHRTVLLERSDWTQIADAPVDKLAWANYRQELRNITNQPGFPWDVEWPLAPT